MGFFQPLFVRVPAAFPVAGVLLLSAYPSGAGFTVFRPVGAWDESRPADSAPLHPVPAIDLRFQRLIQRKHRPPKPFTADGIGNGLGTNAGIAIVQGDTVAALAVAALPANEGICPFPLRWGHAVGRAVRPALQRRQMFVWIIFHASLRFSLLPFSPKRFPAPFLRRVPALARSPQLRDNLSRSGFWTLCPEVRLLAVLPQPGYSFSDGHSVFKVLSIDELS